MSPLEIIAILSLFFIAYLLVTGITKGRTSSSSQKIPVYPERKHRSPTAGNDVDSTERQLVELRDLLEKGLISEDEFEEAKRRALGI